MFWYAVPETGGFVGMETDGSVSVPDDGFTPSADSFSTVKFVVSNNDLVCVVFVYNPFMVIMLIVEADVALIRAEPDSEP